MPSTTPSHSLLRNRRLWLAVGAIGVASLVASTVPSPSSNKPLASITPTSTIAALMPGASSTANAAPIQELIPTLSPISPIVLPTFTLAILPSTPTSLVAQSPSPQQIDTPTSTAIPSPTAEPTQTATPTLTPTSTPDTLTAASIVRVIDGDTFDLLIAGKTERVRIIGVDTPETNGKPICYGQEATDKAKELIAFTNGKLLLEKDVSETDRYNRLLRYVWLDGPSGNTMLNEELVRLGYAQVSTFPPDVKYQERFLAAQQKARAGNRGLWGDCGGFGVPVVQPSSTPAPDAPPTAPPSKPNDSGSPRYDPNGPDRDCGDFSTQQEAQQFFIAAGGPARDPHRLDADHDGIACESLP